MEQRHADLASSIQQVLEEMVLRLARTARDRTGEEALCMAGGVALNCVANGRLLRESGFRHIWPQPAAGDAGAALGAALTVAAEWDELPPPRGWDIMAGAQLGPEFSDVEIRRILQQTGAVWETLTPEELLEKSAAWLAGGRALGWFQGRMEFGPRALGNRSILADPRSAGMQQELNLQVKFRESFRPFAPAVLVEKAHEWFDLPRGLDSPYMLFTAPIHQRHRLPMNPALTGFDRLRQPLSTVPAVTHIDGSARIQTVDSGRHPLFHQLLTRFDNLTGCPMLVNTSFNIRGEPIVATPQDAWRCFCLTNLSALVIGNQWLERSRQLPHLCPTPATPPSCLND